MRFFDFFAGIGGFRLGMEMAGSDYHYMSKGGVMYERSINDGASGY